MLRFSAIAGPVIVVLVAWFSAGQRLEKQSDGGGIPLFESKSIPSQRKSPGLNFRFKTSELTVGSGTLNLPAGDDWYLIVSSTDPAAETTDLSIAREPLESLPSHRWRDASESARSFTNADSFAQSLPRVEPLDEVSHVERELSLQTKPKALFLHVTDGPLDDPRQYATVHSRVIGESEHVRILLDEQEPQSERIETLARRIQNEFEQTILPVCTRTFGTWRDIDGDGKLTILLSPWLAKLQGGKTSLKGFVRGTDFDERIPAPLGNRCDAIYLNSNLASTVNLRTLLGHEYFHVLQCSLRGNQPGRLPLEEDWLTEAEAHLAEQWLQGDDSNLKYRIDAFLDSPGTAPLVVKDYYRAGLWRDDGCRGATFLFLDWCAARHGENFLPRLLRSPETGTRGLETITGRSFQDLHRDWTVSLLSNAVVAGASEWGHACRLRVTSCLSHESIPWTQLEVISLPELNARLRISLAPSAVRFFRISASSRETGLRIEGDSETSLQLTLIDSGQLELLKRTDEPARWENLATELEKSSDSFR
jgi:hypothetical protein